MIIVVIQPAVIALAHPWLEIIPPEIISGEYSSNVPGIDVQKI